MMTVSLFESWGVTTNRDGSMGGESQLPGCSPKAPRVRPAGDRHAAGPANLGESQPSSLHQPLDQSVSLPCFMLKSLPSTCNSHGGLLSIIEEHTGHIVYLGAKLLRSRILRPDSRTFDRHLRAIAKPPNPRSAFCNTSCAVPRRGMSQQYEAQVG